MKYLLYILLFNITLFANNTLIAIDIGHTPQSQGAISARGITEYTFNYRFALELKRSFDKYHINSVIINKDGKQITLKERTKQAQDLNATLFISIHHDSAQLKYFTKWTYDGKELRYSDDFKGYSIFISSTNKQAHNNLNFATYLGNNLVKNKLLPTLHHAEKIKGENRTLIDIQKGIYEFNELAVLRTATMPAVLLECGVIVNREEELKLNEYQYRENIIDSIVKSVISFSKLK